MAKESSANRFSVGLDRWLFAMAVFLGVSVLISYAEENSTPPVIEKPVVCKVKIPSSAKKKIAFSGTGGKTPLPPGKSAERLFHPIIVQVANRYQVDPALVKAIIMAESGYNPQAISKKGARGLMQLMPRTAEALGVEDTFNPEHNINGGVKHLKWLLDKFKGNVSLALAAYNAGTRRVLKHRGIPPIKATQFYIKKVFEYYHYYKKKMSAKMDNA